MTYELVKKKFQQGIVNNVSFLDALSDKFNSNSQLQTALNEVEYQKLCCFMKWVKILKELFNEKIFSNYTIYVSWLFAEDIYATFDVVSEKNLDLVYQHQELLQH